MRSSALPAGGSGGGESAGIRPSARHGWSGSAFAGGTKPGDSGPGDRPVKNRHHVRTRLERFRVEYPQADPLGNR